MKKLSKETYNNGGGKLKFTNACLWKCNQPHANESRLITTNVSTVLGESILTLSYY